MQDYSRRNVLRTLGTGATVLAAGVGTAAACGDDANVRVAHLSPDAPAVDVYVNAEPAESDPAIAGLEFGQVTEYLALDPGEYTVTVTAADSDEAVAPTPVTLNLEQGYYTVAAIGELSPTEDGQAVDPTFDLDVLTDGFDDIPGGKGRVKAYHASPDAPAVDVRVVDGPTLAGDLTFGTASEPVDVAPGRYSVAIYPAGGEEPVLGPVDVVVRANDLLTVFATGFLEPGEGEPGLEAVGAYSRSGNMMGDGAMGEGPPDDQKRSDAAFTRVAHLSPDAPAVDVYVDADPSAADPAVAGIEFGQVTEYLALDPGEREVTITAAGDTEPVPPTPATVYLEPGYYTVAAVGELAPDDGGEPSFSLDVLTDRFDDIPDGKGRVKAFHAAPDAPAVDVRVVDGPTLAAGLEFGTASDPVDVAAGTYPVAVYPAGGDEPVLGPVDVEVRDGALLTVFAAGYLDPDEGEPALQALAGYSTDDTADENDDTETETASEEQH